MASLVHRIDRDGVDTVLVEMTLIMRHVGRILSTGPLGVEDGILVAAVGVDTRRVVAMPMAVLVLGLEGGIQAATRRIGSGGSSFSHDDGEWSIGLFRCERWVLKLATTAPVEVAIGFGLG